jgi:hypothetical protein
MIKKPLLTLLVGFSRNERDIIEYEILKTDRCTYPMVEMNYSCPQPELIHKVIINSRLDFEKHYTLWYHLLPPNRSITMHSLNIKTKDFIDQVDHISLFGYKQRKLDLDVLQQFGYINQEHFSVKKFNYYG